MHMRESITLKTPVLKRPCLFVPKNVANHDYGGQVYLNQMVSQ